MQRSYRTFWHPTGVHCGVWDNGASNHDDAVQRTNGVVADALGLAPGSRVLDAGCGVGGTSFYLAEKPCSPRWLVNGSCGAPIAALDVSSKGCSSEGE